MMYQIFLSVHLQVDVGDLLRFKACVLYTETDQNGDPLIHIEVVAHVIQPEVQSSEVRLNCQVVDLYFALRVCFYS